MLKMLISVIVPLANDDESWTSLVTHLHFLPPSSEIIFVRQNEPTLADLSKSNPLKQKYFVHWMSSSLGNGRAAQMNEGALHASGEFLWFLHADSTFAQEGVDSLLQKINGNSHELFYFKLGYRSAYWLAQLNVLGANVRSIVFGIPFGDQGFCLAKKTFHELGGYDHSCPYGEDHDFIWRARLKGVTLKNVGSTLYSSDRKYIHNGWLRTSVLHIFLTFKQASPYAIALLVKKMKRIFAHK